MRCLFATFVVAVTLQLDAGPAWSWEYLLNGAAGTSDGAFGVVITSGGDVVSGGHLQNLALEVVLMKHSGADGSEVWRQSLPGSSDVGGIHFFEDSNGALLTTVNRQLPTGALSSVLLKLSPSGTELWRIDVPDVHLVAADLDDAGNLVAAGWSDATPYGDLFVIMVNNSGLELWRRAISGGLATGAEEQARAVRFDSNGDVIVAGAIGQNPALNYADFAVFKLAGVDGAELWRSIVPSISAHGGIAWSVEVDSAGDVVAGGQAVLVDWCDAVVVKLSGANGSEMWRSVFDEPEVGSCDWMAAIALNQEGDVFATGAPRTTEFSVFKLSGSTGAKTWRHDVPNFASPTGGECCGGKAIGVRPDGSPVAMGIRLGPHGAGQIAVTRLDPDDGREIYLRIIDTDGCGDAYPGMSLGADGDVAVAGSAFRRTAGVCMWPHGYDYGVFKFAGASGLDFWGGCQDERDNDADGLIDYPSDPQCWGREDASERRSGCGLGFELALVLPLLVRARRSCARESPGPQVGARPFS